MPFAAPGKKTVALLVSTLLSLCLAEVVARIWMPAGYALPTLMTTDGRPAPLAEGFHYLYHYTETAREGRVGPQGRLPSNVRQRLKYDRPTWDYFDADGAVPIVTNRLGFHDRDFDAKKRDGEFRVLALGDSFTYGLGVPLEDSWPQQLERRLEPRLGRVEVVNAGWPNTAPPDYLEWFRTDGIRLEPDLVLVGLCLNDMAPVPMLAYPQATPAPWLGGVSALLNHVQREIEQRRLIAEKRDYAAMIDADPGQWNATQAALLEIRRISRDAGAKFGLVVLPMVSRLGDDYPYLRMHALADAFAKANDMPCVDLLPAFRGRDEHALWVHPTDQHPNRVGQTLIADGVFEFVEREGLAR